MAAVWLPCFSPGMPGDTRLEVRQHPPGLWAFPGKGGGCKQQAQPQQRPQLQSLLCWLSEEEPAGGEEEEMPTFSYRLSGKDTPLRGGQGVQQGLILPSLCSGRAQSSCSQCQKNLSLQTAVKVLYVFSILLIVAVTILAALGELLPSPLPSLGQLHRDPGALSQYLQHPGMDRSIRLSLTFSCGTCGTLCVMPPCQGFTLTGTSGTTSELKGCHRITSMGTKQPLRLIRETAHSPGLDSDLSPALNLKAPGNIHPPCGASTPKPGSSGPGHPPCQGMSREDDCIPVP